MSAGANVSAPGRAGPTVFVACPTYLGIAADSPVRQMLCAWQSRLRARGGAMSFAPLKGCGVIGRARAELVTWFLNPRECFERLFGESGTGRGPGQCVEDFDPDHIERHDVMVWIDDDVVVEPEDGLDRMLAVLDHGAPIVSAPAMIRTARKPNFMGPSEPYAFGPERVIDVDTTGFGCVAIRRDVIERMALAYDESLHCRSASFPGLKTWALFNSIVVKSHPNDPDQVMLDDDYAWSVLARECGYTIRAAIDISTNHRGLRCAVGEEYDARATGGRIVLLGA